MQDFQTWAETCGATVRSQRTELRDIAENFEGMSHWKVRIMRAGRSMIVDYSMGSAYRDPPDVAGVLYAVLMDWSGLERRTCEADSSEGLEGLDFETWCGNYGMEPDSNARRIFRACVRNANALERLFTHAELEKAARLAMEY